MWRTGRWVAVTVMSGCLTAGGTGVATATHLRSESGPSSVTALVAQVAEADQRLADLGAQIQFRTEAVNQAIDEVGRARDAAAAAQSDVQKRERSVAQATQAIRGAQERFDAFAVAVYVHGPSETYLLPASPEDILATASAGEVLSRSFQQTMADLQRARLEAVNQESAARAAQRDAERAADDARRAQDRAVAALAEAKTTFAAQQNEVTHVVQQRNSAQAELTSLRAVSGTPSSTTDRQAVADQWDRASAPMGSIASHDVGQWDTTLPMVPSANITGDPLVIINSVLQVSANSAKATADLGRKFLVKLGILKEPAAAADPGITNGRIPTLYGRQASEYVVRRAMSQIGVPYSWGGGNANGPSRGIDDGAGTVGFDCSGLMLYAFAGVGIKLPHYSGSQYNAGRKVPSSQMRRGDLIFYGPNASQHEAMYLGDGMMLEAPYTGSSVKVSPVRTSGMTPYVTRMIEY
ncbi:NlpC/P60 family peptidoglycan endopeptidase RipA [Mycolicibacterium sp.]|uniref:NlpC/P60 family peptidoglycan endopeptidase RipA n=1 Tax=Mycolicibacterium sp. TaxID=2320850 RepID=UPI0037C8D7A6